jgi:exonuclease SbcC
MKPIKLEIEGIKSFKERVVIDFKTLIDRGLFGIFGNTGSGKSSILYCINLALYYNNSFGKKDFINTKCDYAFVSLSFELIQDGIRKTFLVTREFKGQNSPQAFLYKADGEKKICIQEKSTEVTQKIIELIGLNFDEFKKCIALPQGEFSSFIKSTSGDKMKIIASLFSLEDYSEKIFNKTNERKKELEIKNLNLITRLLEYEDTSKEIIENLEKEILKINKDKEVLTVEHKNIKTKFETDKKTFDINTEFEKTEINLNKLLERKPYIENLEILLEKANNYSDIFYDINLIKETEAQLSSSRNQLTELKLINKTNSENYKNIEYEIENKNFDLEIEQLTEKTALLKSLENSINQINSKNLKKDSLLNNYRLLKKELTEKVTQEQQITADLEELNHKMEELNLKSDLTSDINKIKPLFLNEEYKENLKYFNDKKNKLTNYINDTKLYFAVETEINSRIEYYKSILLDTRENIDLSVITAKLKEQKDELEKLSKNINNLQNKQSVLKEKIKYLTINLVRITEEGKEISQEIIELEKIINKNTDGLEYNTLIKDLQQKFKDVKDYKVFILKKKEDNRNKLNKSENEIGLTEQKINNLVEKNSQLKISLNKKIEAAKINSLENIEEFNINDDEKKKFKKEIEDFKYNFSAAKSRYDELKPKVNKLINYEYIMDVEKKLSCLDTEINDCNRIIGIKESEKIRLNNKLSIKLEKQQEQKENS